MDSKQHQYILKKTFIIYAEIDVAKHMHDCFITNSDSEVLHKPFTISNNKDEFDELYNRICSSTEDFSNFATPNKILAYVGLSPSIYQFGQLYSAHSYM